ncbi:ATP-binding protein, partial [Sphaerisporangium aureirubrum]
GRDDALTDITAQLTRHRLVTLTGPGGVGKTRLALETATRLAPTFPDGVRLVELAALDRSGTTGTLNAVTGTLTTALDIRDTTDTPATPLDRLSTALRDRRMLLVLDNCEHLVDHVAHLTAHLLRTAPGLRVLATSQEPLALAGEIVWNVPPLDVPGPHPDPGRLHTSSAVRLFTARAAAATRGFTLDDTTAHAVATLCRRLDGIPLALELAATKVPALGVHGLVARLDDRFRLLATGHRGAPPRQQTLTAMIDWSWELLTPDERTVLRRLAVHADGCALDAAEAVTSGPGLPPAAVLPILTRLVDRSLVTAVHTTDGPRYRLLESVAHYCAERMHHTGELPDVRARHRHHYTTLAEHAAPHLHGHHQRHWLHRLDTETPNLRLALENALTTGDPHHALRLTTALTWYWFLRGRLTEARDSLKAALDLPTPRDNDAPGGGTGQHTTGEEPAGEHPTADRTTLTALRAVAAAWHAGITLLQGTATPGTTPRDTAHHTAHHLATTTGDPIARARAQWFLAYAGIDAGDLTTSNDLLDQAQPAFDTHGDHWGTAAVLVTRTKLAHIRGDLTTLDHHARTSAATFRTLGDRWGELQATGWLGALAEMTGDYTTAARLHHDGLRMARELDLWPDVAGQLAWLGWIALQQADYTTARDLCRQAATLATEQGFKPLKIFAEMGLGFTARKSGHLDTAETHLRTVLDTTPHDHHHTEPAPHLPMILTELGYIAEQRGDPHTARTLHLQALTLAQRFDAPREKVLALEGLAGALTLTGHHTHAAHLLGAARALRTAAALPLAPAEQADIDRITTRARDTLGDTPYTDAYHHGTTLTPDQAGDLARTP